MRNTYQIKEYGSFITGKEIEGDRYVTLPESTFKHLENFILANRNKETDALELMGISVKKGIGKVITAKNYVGVITMNDGTVIEILPKIDCRENDEKDGGLVRTKKVLTDMLKTLRKSPYKSLQTSDVNIEKLNIFELFIRMFIDEVFLIVKRGMKCGYQTVRENERFFKGKIQFSDQIKRNCVHKERCYVAYDCFTGNRPENMLIKATLLYLYKRCVSLKNKRDIQTLLCSFSKVDASTDYDGDFAKYAPDRNMKDYDAALLWCAVFLKGKSFTAFAGAETAHALLFPMETLFESYIAALLKKKLSIMDYSVCVQDKSLYLFDKPGKAFLLKPDIVVTRKSDNAVFILDTKWKTLVSGKAGFGIAQADLYQMYAYQKKYQAENVTLLYPMTDKAPADKPIAFSSDDGVRVRVEFVDLFDIQKSMTRIAALF